MNLQSLISSTRSLLDIIIILMASFALLFFFWGLATFILASGDESKKTEGKNRMIWGTVALFVMFSIWGLVNLVGTILGINPGSLR